MNCKTESASLIAACGLYCSNCSKFKKGKCPGCAEYNKAIWCKIRTCCHEKGIANCSNCEDYIYPKECPKYNNFISRSIEFFSGTDRSLCIEFLRKNSPEKFIAVMNVDNRMSMLKRKKTNK